MKAQRSQRDLVVLVADRDIEAAVEGLLNRPQSLGTRPIDFAIYRHPGRDAGCRSQGDVFLRTFSRQFRHALLVFDREGSGREQNPATDIEDEMEDLLSQGGWSQHAACIVLDPELEIWVWSDSPHVDRVMGWSGRIPRSATGWSSTGTSMTRRRSRLAPKKRSSMRSALCASRSHRHSFGNWQNM